MTTAQLESGAGAAAGAAADRWSRLSDLLNPILVREVQQAVKGRVFALTVMAALAISVLIAVLVASQYEDEPTGTGAFNGGFATLIPLLVFVVPMHAYQSMRTELRSGIVEQLLLSRMSPGQVLFGKLQAAMVQFVLYVSVMAPLLATSYLLRGVDLPTIALSLGFLFVVCITTTAFALSSAAQAIVPALQPIANLGVAFALGMATVALVGFVGSGGYAAAIGVLLRSGELPAVLSGVLLLALAITVLSWLAARSFLLHAFEDKSSGFRIFLFALPVVAFAWMFAFVDPTALRFAVPALSLALLLTGTAFGAFMVTEQRTLSPRVRAHAPARPWLALLAAPFLPGRDRGLLCFALYSVLLVAAATLSMPDAARSMPGRDALVRVGLLAIAYAFVYLCAGRFLRGILPDTSAGNAAGRILLPVAMFLACIVPLLVDVFAHGGEIRWHYGHALNPFFTIEHCMREELDVRWVVSLVLAVLALLHVPVFVRGVAEVARAAAARRAREAGVRRPVQGG